MNKLFAGIIIIVIIIFIGLSSIFTVNEYSSAIVLKLGKIKRSSDGQVIVYTPGLHFKTPFIDTVKDYDMRLHTLTLDSARIVTSEQKDVLIDSYVEWKITNISTFYRSTAGNMIKVDNLLKQYVESSMRADVGKRTIQELINNERDELMQELIREVASQAKAIGVNIIDVRVKQIDLPDTVTESIYQRMSSDREKAAAAIRADGTQTAEKIKAKADAEVTVLTARAASEGKQIKAKGEAEAAGIYTKVYSKDPGFYEFMRSMQAYQDSFQGKNDVLVLKPQGKFFKFFNPSVALAK